jgi:hypothetical protein
MDIFSLNICLKRKREKHLLELTKIIETNFKNYNIYISRYNNISK